MNSIIFYGRSKTTFPKKYFDIIHNSQISLIEIAHKLKISERRFKSLLYSQGKMDNVEFRSIKKFVESIEEENNGKI